jgi:osmoprotectant transport system substrate-binding protein
MNRCRDAWIDTPSLRVKNAAFHPFPADVAPENPMKAIRTTRMLAAAATALLLAATPALAQVKVGSKNFTEQFIVAELYAQALEAAGIKVERKINLGGTMIAHKALEEKQIDL